MTSDTVKARTVTSTAVPAVALIALVMSVGGLVVYKASGAITALGVAHTERVLHAKSRWLEAADSGVGRSMTDALNYASWVAIALAFGILIAASVRAFVPDRWLVRTIAGSGLRGHVVAGLIGAPLMLCSCCIAPVFEGVYARTRKLGPALAMMFAAPALNPAVIAATFLIFPITIASLRLAAGLVLVLGASQLLARAHREERAVESCQVELEAPGLSAFARAFAGSLATVTWRSLPAIGFGIIVAMAIAGWLPIERLATGTHPIAVVVIVALVAVPLPLPTFGEIPLALGLLAAGAPAGAAAALLVAGPTVNLPSLLSLARATSWRVAVASAATVFATAFVVGLVVVGLA